MNDSNITPLLMEDLENEMKNLKEEEKNLLHQINELSYEIENMNNGNVANVKGKFDKLEKKMKNMLSKISHVSSYKNLQPKVMKALSQTSQEISQKYDLLNNKFQSKIQLAQQNLQTSIERQKNSFYNSPITIKSHPLIVSTNNQNIERLKQIQKEYQMIESTSKKILDISNDIRQISQRQNQKIDDISQNIFSIEQAAFDANKEVQTLKDSTRNSKSKYCWIALGLFVSLIILILMFYEGYIKGSSIFLGQK